MTSSAFKEGLLDFTFEAYRQIPKNGNEVFSPFSLSAALLLLMMGSNGTTKNEIRRSMFKNEIPSDIDENYKMLSDELAFRTRDEVTLYVANRLFGQKDINIVESFTANALNFYGSELEPLDFVNNPEPSREKINQWIAEKTEDMIHDMLPPKALDQDTVMVLVNAIYFKGNWSFQFNPNDTEQATFYVSESTQKQVEMMQDDNHIALAGYNPQLKCKVLNLPYKGEEMSMIFILPDRIDGLVDLENKLTPYVFRQLLASVHNQTASIGIPTFKIKSSYDLIPVLSKMGINEIFDENAADFSAMVHPPPNLYVSYARQDAVVDVYEEGSKAAAASNIIFKKTALSFNFKFNADHPFLFVIVENISGTILFIGRYVEP